MQALGGMGVVTCVTKWGKKTREISQAEGGRAILCDLLDGDMKEEPRLRDRPSIGGTLEGSWRADTTVEARRAKSGGSLGFDSRVLVLMSRCSARTEAHAGVQ